MSILEEIYAHKQEEVAEARRALSGPILEMRARRVRTPPDFVAALRDQSLPRPRLIAEAKARSPSKGTLCQDYDPVRLARAYAANGAAALSVLTDSRYFGGSLDDLEAVAALPDSPPVLRKDFLFDPYQLYEARHAGASAVLLIAAMLESALLSDLIQHAEDLALAPLVEVHNRAEVDEALEAGARLIGINNRNLHTFNVDLSTSLRLRPQIPPEITVVAESGISREEDVKRLAEGGLDAMLIGEHLVTASDPGARARQLARIDPRRVT